MADVTGALADLKAEIADLGSRMDASFKALQAAQAASDPAKEAAVVAEIEADVQALKDIGTRDALDAGVPAA